MSDEAERERARYEAVAALAEGYRRERDEARERLATAERLNEVNNRIIGGLLSTIESMSTVDASYDDDEP